MHWTQHIKHMGSHALSCLQTSLELWRTNVYVAPAAALTVQLCHACLPGSLDHHICASIQIIHKTFTADHLMGARCTMTICSHTCTRMFQQQPQTEMDSPSCIHTCTALAHRSGAPQVVDILSRIGVVERASIDECYLDLTEESHSRLAACNGQPGLPANADRVHICGQVCL